MKLTTFAAILFASSIPFPALAQDKSDTDLSRYEILEEGEHLKTLAEIQDMEDEYKLLVASGNCEEALPKIISFYETANKAANIIRQGNEPYYDARRDDQDKLAGDSKLLRILIKAESTSNNLIHQRNSAWVAEAKCLLEKGEKEAAVHRLYRALDYIGTTDYSSRLLWEEARNMIWNEVGFDPQAK